MSLVERITAFVALLILLPALTAIALAILILDGGPVLFRQERIGRQGRPFELLKFRSMRQGAVGAEVTASGDSRITSIGQKLRKYKLDEFPQLWNIVVGDMSFIGSRPEVPGYVDYSDPVWQAVLARRPGITDLATLAFRNEEALLAGVSEPDVFYRSTILPEKLALNLQYNGCRTRARDVKLVALTIIYSLFPGSYNADSVKRRLLR